MIYQRHIINCIINSLKTFPVVFINGARQVGKSTLVHEILKSYPADYLTMDDLTALSAATEDPTAFVDNFVNPIALDEIQRVPEIFLPIKKAVDENKRAGSFILTGSSNVLTMPKISESLAGRMMIHTLFPLSQGEIRGEKENFVDWLFGEKKFQISFAKSTSSELSKMLVIGGYPRVMQLQEAERREWFTSYLGTILQRDIRDLAQIEGLMELPCLLNLIAGRVGNLSNLADLARALKINSSTLKRYYTLLKMVFLVVELPAWFKNKEKTLVKSPKIFLNDTGLLCYLLKINEAGLIANRTQMGHILENFVVMELIKQIGWSVCAPGIYHFRTQQDSEVDVVLEGVNQKIVGIEIKSAAAVSSEDFKGLTKLAAIVGDNFWRGVVLYTGEHVISFGKQLTAIPLSALYTTHT